MQCVEHENPVDCVVQDYHTQGKTKLYKPYWRCPECTLTTSQNKCPGYKAWVKSDANALKVAARQDQVFQFFRKLIPVETLRSGDLEFMLSMYLHNSASMSPNQYSNLNRILTQK